MKRKNNWASGLALAMVAATAVESHPYVAIAGFFVLMIYLVRGAVLQGNFRKPDPETARREGQALAVLMKQAEANYWAAEQKRKTGINQMKASR